MTRRRTTSRWPDPQANVADPPFAGPGWCHKHANTWVYQDLPEAARVQAALLDDGSWFLDLWSAQNRLLTRGSAPPGEVGSLAPALTANARRWAPPTSIETSQRRFAETAEAVRGSSRLTPDEARVRAATATSPANARSAHSPAAAAAAPPPGAHPPPPGAARPSR